MADNLQVTQGSGTTIAADDIGGVLFQRIKNTWGADGTAVDVSASNPMPVVQTGALPTGNNKIGNVDLASALPAGANNIGTVGLAAGANTIGSVNIASALPAGSNNIGRTTIGGYIPPTAGMVGQTSIPTTTDAVQVVTASTPIRGVMLKNPAVIGGSNNTAQLYVGFANTVSDSTGYELSPGGELYLDIDNLNKLWVRSSAANRFVHYIGTN